jgi:hypothetical protein
MTGPHPLPLSHRAAVDPQPLSRVVAGEGRLDALPARSPRPAQREEGPGVRGAAT